MRSAFRAIAFFTGLLLALLFSPNLSQGGVKLPRLKLDRLELKDNRLVLPLRKGYAVTTLDPYLKKRADRIMKRYRLTLGGVVMVDVKTGRLMLAAGYSHKKPGGAQIPFRSAHYLAASIFKIITMTALLNEGLKPSKVVCYRGGLRKIRLRHLRPSKRDYRCRKMHDAFARSSNVPFARMAVQHLSAAKLRKAVHLFGFGRGVGARFGVEESDALIGSDPLTLGRTAAGFGHVYISPFLAAFMAATVANKGVMPSPFAVEKIVKGRKSIRLKPQTKGFKVTSSKNAAAVARAMRDTCRRGTARKYYYRIPRWMRKLGVAGKTGSLADKKPYLEYTWFVGFAPVKKPRVAVAALVGNTPLWHIKGTQLALMMLTHYFRRERKARKARRKKRRRRRTSKRGRRRKRR